MSFRFDALLRLRLSLEHQQEQRLRAANQWVARLREMLRQAESGLASLTETQNQRLRGGMSAAELQFLQGAFEALEQRRRELGQQMIPAERMREQQHQVLLRIREQREMLESLKVGEDRERHRQSSRREQRELDEAFLLRQSRTGKS